MIGWIQNMEIQLNKNFIKDLPENENCAIDESLLYLQVRVRKGTAWERILRSWVRFAKGEISPEEYSDIMCDY